MPIKRKIDKTAFDALSDDMKKNYKKNGSSDDYILDTDGDDDKTTELKSALENARNEAKELKKKQDDAEKAAKDATEAAERAAAKKAGDFDSIERGYQDKLTAKDNEIAGMKAAHKQQLDSVLIDAAAETLAAKISTTPDLVKPIIAARLSVDMAGDKPITRVLGADGKASALTVDDLGKELASDKRYSAVMIANKGSGGGGAPPGQHKGGALGRSVPLPNGPDGKPPILASMTPQQLAETMKARREQQQQDSGAN